MFEYFDFGKKVTDKFIDFDIDENLSFDEQCFSFKEDMLQISYEKDYVLDIGWYPDHNPTGSFKIVVIKDYDWVNPVFIERCREVKVLVKYMEKFITYIQKELE